MRWGAIVVAAGRGTRLGGPKQFVELAGLPMVGWSLRTLASIEEIAELVVATEPESIAPMSALLVHVAPQRVARVVRGGETRRQSVANALSALSGQCDATLVHDGARPLVTEHDVRAGMREVRPGRAALLAAPVVDTVKQIAPGAMSVVATLDRSTLWAAQTPQFALTADLRSAHERARQEGLEATDDAVLLELIGIEVVVVPATSENFKVTLPGDVERAQALLSRRARAMALR